MQKLKLQTFCHLSESILKILAQNHITTILDFLQEDVTKLATLTKLNLPEILAIRNDIFTKYSAPLINGTTLLKKVLETRRRIRTSIDSLDAVTNGGIPVGYITEICGLAESGKTQLLFQLAINCVKDAENTVLYVDTKGDFSAVRIQKMLDAKGCSHKEMAMIMYKIRVVHIWTMDELVDLFKSIKNKTLTIENLALIIVDSLPCLMFQYLGDENKIGLSLLNTLVNYSRFICNEFNVGMIYVNIQTRWIDLDVCDLEEISRNALTAYKRGRPALAGSVYNRKRSSIHQSENSTEFEAVIVEKCINEASSTSAFKEPSYIEKRNRCLGRYWEQVPNLIILLTKLDNQSKQIHDTTQIKVSVVNANNSSDNKQCIINLSVSGIE